MMLNSRGWWVGVLACSLLLPAIAWGQARETRPKRVGTAKFTDQKVVVDGVLDDAAWADSEVFEGFTQKEPEDGKPATEQTEVRILYNKEFLYFAAYCHDSVPNGLIINDIGRDFDIQEQDYFALVLDTFNDNRNGYYLGATVEGNQRDIQFTDEGRNQNVNWDGVWYSQGHRVEDGYTVEIAVPFNTLRFSKEKKQVWGLQLVRRIRRRNEVVFWSPISRRYTGISAVALAGELQGIEDVEPGRNLQIKPYGLAGIKHLPSVGEETKGNFEGGLDVKYGVTSGLTLDLTANTDFSQVEADAQQVNLTRFPLFFAEKREFFLENSGIFQFGSLSNNEALLFHSRTIGLANGRPVPILGGARLTGRSGPYSLGLLNMQTRSKDAIPATNFTVARARRNILQSSDVGFMLLNRRSGMKDDHNRAFGADGDFIFLRNKLRFSGGLAKTSSPALTGDDRLGKFEAQYQTDLVRVESSYVDIGKNFNPEMGFVRRRGRRIISNDFVLQPRLSPSTRVGHFLRDLFFTENHQYIVLADGRPETKYLLNEFRAGFQDGGTFGTHYELNYEHLTRPFEISDGIFIPVGDYRFNESKLWYTSDQSKPISGDLEWLWSDYYSGTRTELVMDLKTRPNFRFSTDVKYTHDNIQLAEGAFTTDLASLRVDYNFNPKMFLTSFIQYNSEADQISTNVRFRLNYRPLSDIFLVYNDVHDRANHRADWNFTVKYTRLLNF